jgi:hypothetical protein
MATASVEAVGDLGDALKLLVIQPMNVDHSTI